MYRGLKKLTFKGFKALFNDYPTTSIRFREIGGAKLEVYSIVPGKHGNVLTPLGIIQLPRGT